MRKNSLAWWRVGGAATIIAIIGVAGFFGTTAVAAFTASAEASARAEALDEEIVDSADYITLHEKEKAKTEAALSQATRDLLVADSQMRYFKESEVGYLAQESADRASRLSELRIELASLQGEQLGLQMRAASQQAFGERQLMLGGLFTLLLVIVLLLIVIGSRRGMRPDRLAENEGAN